MALDKWEDNWEVIGHWTERTAIDRMEDDWQVGRQWIGSDAMVGSKEKSRRIVERQEMQHWLKNNW